MSFAVPAASQVRRSLPGDSAQCARCSIDLTLTVSIGKDTDRELLAGIPALALRADGRVVAAGVRPRGSLLVYDTRGNLVDSVGRYGQGPGEFLRISSLESLPGDSLLVVDLGTRRLTVLDPQNRYVRSFVLPYRFNDFVAVSPSLWIVAGTSEVAGRVGYPMQRTNATGTDDRPFGRAFPVLRDRPSASQRAITGNSRSVWAVRPDRYELEEYDLNGSLVRVIDRIVSWFPDREFESSPDLWSAPADPRIRDLHLDAEGRLWVMAGVAKAGWRRSSQDTDRSFWAYARAFDTIIEVIDVASNTVLAHTRFPWFGYRFTQDGYVLSYRVSDDDGVVSADVRRATFLPSAGR